MDCREKTIAHGRAPKQIGTGTGQESTTRQAHSATADLLPPGRVLTGYMLSRVLFFHFGGLPDRYAPTNPPTAAMLMVMKAHGRRRSPHRIVGRNHNRSRGGVSRIDGRWLRLSQAWRGLLHGIND